MQIMAWRPSGTNGQIILFTNLLLILKTYIELITTDIGCINLRQGVDGCRTVRGDTAVVFAPEIRDVEA